MQQLGSTSVLQRADAIHCLWVMCRCGLCIWSSLQCCGRIHSSQGHKKVSDCQAFSTHELRHNTRTPAPTDCVMLCRVTSKCPNSLFTCRGVMLARLAHSVTRVLHRPFLPCCVMATIYFHPTSQATVPREVLQPFLSCACCASAGTRHQ